MSRHAIPADVDRLLWEVAESQDQSAFDDFERRFPHLVGELGQRIQLVRELRGAKSNGHLPGKIPAFEHRQPSRAAPANRLAWAGGALVLAGLALGAFSVTRNFMRVAPTPVVQRPLPNPNVAPPVQLPTPDPTPVQQGTTTGGPVPDPKPSPSTGPKFLQPQDVMFSHTKMQTAMLAIAQTNGLTIEFAPNCPNPEIDLNYHRMNPIDIFKDMGRQFGFTPFKNGNRAILIVPARDPNAVVEPPASGYGHADYADAPASSTTKPGPRTNQTKLGSSPE